MERIAGETEAWIMRDYGHRRRALALVLASGCAGGVGGDGGSPFASGADIPATAATGESGDELEPDTTSGGAEESGTTAAIVEETSVGDESSSAAHEDGSGGASHCLPSTDDCDGDGVCEADLDAVETCGACDKSCVLPSTTLTCTAGTCEGIVSLVDIADAFIDDDDDSANFGSAGYLIVVDDADIDIALVKPNDLGGIPVGATVTSAELVLSCTTAGSPMTIVELASAWDEQTVTWNGRPRAAASGTTHAAVAGPNAIPITAIAQAWVDAGAPVHGLQLATTGEDDNIFASRESTTATDHPRFELTISY